MNFLNMSFSVQTLRFIKYNMFSIIFFGIIYYLLAYFNLYTFTRYDQKEIEEKYSHTYELLDFIFFSAMTQATVGFDSQILVHNPSLKIICLIQVIVIILINSGSTIFN